jgi:hypothetical protein
VRNFEFERFSIAHFSCFSHVQSCDAADTAEPCRADYLATAGQMKLVRAHKRLNRRHTICAHKLSRLIFRFHTYTNTYV